jgi:hypothetical protein
MSLTVTDLTTLDPTQVEQFRQQDQALIQEYNPGADLKRGPLQDLVITPKAALDTATQTNIDLIRQSSSLLEINANPTLADTDTVNRLLSNYGLTRNPGAAATGTVTIVLSALVPTVIQPSTIFTINGLTFQPIMTYAGRVTSQLVVGPGDVLITALGSNYAFSITVQATAVGAAGNVTNGSTATLSLNPPQFVQAYAQGNFTGGQDEETNEQLIIRLQSGLAAKTWSNRATIDAMLKQQFPALMVESIIGFGDAEMLRDAHALWPGHAGGRSDTYVRTAQPWQAVVLTKTATLQSVSGVNGTWQFTVGRDDAPGYYEIDRILLPSMALTATGFAPSSDVRSWDFTPDATHSYFPDVTATIEAVYSRYQTSTVQFVDTVTNASSLTPGVSTAQYVVIFRTMPQVAAIQDFLGQRNNRPPMGDILVKAAVPCFMTASMTLNILTGTTVDVAALQNALAVAVNTAGFIGSIAASMLSQVLHNALGAALVSITGISLAGRIRKPDGTNVSISSSTNLSFSNDNSTMTTNRTVIFLLNATDVTLTIVNVPAPTL